MDPNATFKSFMGNANSGNFKDANEQFYSLMDWLINKEGFMPTIEPHELISLLHGFLKNKEKQRGFPKS